MALRDEANALDDEAATWLLLWFLAGDKDARFPGGWGGPGGAQALAAAQAVGRTTVHHQVADIIAEDPHINRFAPVRCQPDLPTCGCYQCHARSSSSLLRVANKVTTSVSGSTVVRSNAGLASLISLTFHIVYGAQDNIIFPGRPVG